MSNEVEHLRCALGALNARRDRANATLERLNPLIVALEEEIKLGEEILEVPASSLGTAPPLPPAPPAGSAANAAAPSGAGVYSKMSVGDAAAEMLRLASKPQKTVDIVNALQAGGQTTVSTNYYRLVYNTLADRARREDSNVRKVGQNWAYQEPK
jgi:hypothetical protein